MPCPHPAATTALDHGKAKRCLACGHRIAEWRHGRWVQPRRTRWQPGRWLTEHHRRWRAVHG